MADTVNKQSLVPDQYYSLNTLFGIPVGTAISIQNQTSKAMKISIGTQPAVGADDYLLFGPFPMPPIGIDAGEAEVWVFGAGDINVQVV